MNKVVKLYTWSNPAYMKANDRERMEAYICEYKGGCYMYNCGKCVCEKGIFSDIKCPHSTVITRKGLTKRAKNFGVASFQWKEEYKTDIETDNKQIRICGDYIYLPYSYLNVLGAYPFDESLVNSHFIPANLFDVEMIRKLVNYRPQAMMGGEIEKFQKEEIPKFIRHLKIFSPGLFNAYIKAYPEDAERFNSIAENYVGRKAYLYSLKEGTCFYDSFKNKWIKENGFIVCENYDFCGGITVGEKPRKVMHSITNDMIVEIDDNDYVKPADTVFVD